MKKMMMTMAMMVTMITSAAAMTFSEAREHALFLTDKMTYELGLTSIQADNVYEINLDYVVAVAIQGQRNSTALAVREADLRYVLSDYQYHIYKKTNYFYRPMTSSKNVWSLNVYKYYTNRSHFLAPRPNAYQNYKGATNPRKSYSPTVQPQAGKQVRKTGQLPSPQPQRTVTQPQQNQPQQNNRQNTNNGGHFGNRR